MIRLVSIVDRVKELKNELKNLFKIIFIRNVGYYVCVVTPRTGL